MKHFVKKNEQWEVISISDKYCHSYPLSEYNELKEFEPRLYFGDDEFDIIPITGQDQYLLIGLRYILKEKNKKPKLVKNSSCARYKRKV